MPVYIGYIGWLDLPRVATLAGWTYRGFCICDFNMSLMLAEIWYRLYYLLWGLLLLLVLLLLFLFRPEMTVSWTRR